MTVEDEVVDSVGNRALLDLSNTIRNSAKVVCTFSTLGSQHAPKCCLRSLSQNYN